MNKNYNVSGDKNIFGNNNIQINNESSVELEKKLVELIGSLSAGQEKKDLLADLQTVKSKDETPVNKGAASGRIATFLKVVAGEAGKVILKEMMTSGLNWAKTIEAISQ